MSEPPEPDDDAALLDLAGSVSAGSPVDWQAAEAKAGAGRGPVVRALGLIARIAEVHRSLQRTVILEPGEAPAEGRDAGPPVPGRWGHLELLEEVGEGASADVYRARDTRLEREVALKLLRRSPHHDETSNEAVLREGRLLARVHHPNVATVYGADEHDGRVGVWMEYVRGKTLNRLIAEQGPLGAREASLIGIDLCRALAAVHEKGVVHRDLKAQNVMRELGGRILLVDFGIGRDIASEEQSAPSLSGTPLYLAPETFAGQPATIQSDLYSLGVLLFYLATGKFPVVGGSLDDLRAAHDEGRVTLLRDLRPDLPGWFVDAVEKALARDPAARFATAGQMERALGQMSGTWNRVGEGRAEQPAAAAERRWVWKAVATLVVLALLALIGGLSEWQRRRQHSEAERLFRQAEDLHNAGHIEQAISALEVAVAKNRGLAKAHDLLSICQAGIGRFEDADRSSAVALRMSEALGPVEKSRALASSHLNRLQYEQAKDECEMVVAVEPDDATTRRLLAMVLGTLRKPDQAALEMRKARDSDPGDVIGQGELAVLLAQANRPDESLGEIEKARSALAGVDLTYLFWGEGLAYLMKGEGERATQAFGHLAKGQDVYESNGQLFLAQVAVYEGRLLDAVAVLGKGLIVDGRREFEANRATRLEWLARLNLLLGDGPPARDALENLERVRDLPSFFKALRGATLGYVQLRDTQRARALLSRLKAVRDRYPSSIAIGAVAQVEAELARLDGDPARAEELFRLAYERWPDASTLESLSRFWMEQDKPARALPLVEERLTQKGLILGDHLATQWVLAHLDLARCLTALGRKDEARRSYDEFLDLWGEHGSDLGVVKAARNELATITSR